MKAVTLPSCRFPFAAAVRSIPVERRGRKVTLLRDLWREQFERRANHN